MKEIKAYIKAFKRDDVIRAFHGIEGLERESLSDVLGSGRGKGESSGYVPDADPAGYIKHVKVKVVC